MADAKVAQEELSKALCGVLEYADTDPPMTILWTLELDDPRLDQLDVPRLDQLDEMWVVPGMSPSDLAAWTISFLCSLPVEQRMEAMGMSRVDLDYWDAYFVEGGTPRPNGTLRPFSVPTTATLWADRYEAMPAFERLDGPLVIKGRGRVFIVKNPGDLPNPGELIGQTVTIDDVEYEVTGYERQGRGPHPADRPIGLLVAD